MLALVKAGTYTHGDEKLFVGSRKQGGYVLEVNGTSFEFAQDGTFEDTQTSVVLPNESPLAGPAEIPGIRELNDELEQASEIPPLPKRKQRIGGKPKR